MKTIGLKRLTVKLLPHNPKWEEIFNLEYKKLKNLFPYVEHVGSTAIKGIKAKPIIDIDIGIPLISKSKDYFKPLKKLGYEFRPDNSSLKHLFFVKGKENNRTHYLHLIKYEGQIWKDDLFFRDYLNKHRQFAKTYEKLKTELAEKFNDTRPKYTKAKKQFIKKIIAKRKGNFI